MILKGISVNQNPPTKDYLWITPKGNARFWDQSNWRLIGGSGGGGTNIPEPTAAGKYLITAGSSGDYYATWGDLNLNSYINGDVGYAAVFNGSNSITSAKLTNSKIRIGDGIIEWDSTNKGFKIYNATSTQETPTTAGIYADWVSALGANSSGGGGGGDINWANLTTWDEDPEHIINENYLPYNAGTGLSLNGTTFNHSNSISQGNFGLSNNTTANSVTLPYVSYDGQGHISAVSSNTFTIGNLDASTVFNSSTKIPFINLPDLYIGYTKISNSTNSNAQLKGISKITHATTDNDTSTAAIEWDSTNNAWHFYGGIYSDSFVSALGAGSGSGGGGGINVVDLWNELTNATGSDPSYQNTQIAVAHIPTLSITDKTSGTLPISRGGTGRTTTASGAWYNTAANQTSPTIGTLPIAQGGTGNTTGTATYATTTADTSNTLYPIGVTNGATTTLKRDTSIAMTGGSLTGITSITTTGGNGLLSYKPSSWTGVSSSQWGVGTIDIQGVIRSSNTDLLHSRNGTNSVILDASNYNSYSPTLTGIGASGTWGINISGNASTATTASKLGTSTVGGPIRPFYLNAGVATACSLYRYHYDGTSDWESYAWHKVAYCTASAYADYSIRFLVSNGNGVSSGILSCRGRWDANAAFSSANTYLAWTVMSNGFNKSNFVLVWKSPNLELWCKIPAQWAGYQFAVLDSGYRADNGALTWTLCDSINGHGVDSYTSGGTVITSGIDTIYTGNIVGGVNNYYMPNYNDAGVYYHGTGISWHNSSNAYVRNLLSFDTNGYSTFGNKVTIPSLRITSTTDVSGSTAPTASTPLVIGSETGEHVEIDSNEILAKSNGTTISSLYLQDGSGTVYINGTGGLKMSTTSGYFYMPYNSSNYPIIKNYNNGCVSIDTCGTGLFLGHENTTYIDFLNSAGRWTSTGLGIGTTSPAYKLDVSGVINATDVICGYAYSKSNNMAAFVFDKPGSNFTGIGAVGVSDTIHFGPCNKPGAWVSNYNQKWEFQGDVYALGGVTALASISSDKRLKKEIKPFNAKQIIDKLKPVEFEWNKKANKYNSNLELNKKNYGLIAQDSDGIIDNLVFDLPDGKGYKGVRYEKLIPILLQAVKEQQKEIDELKQIIKKLKV